ncbi:MAG: N-acetylmuramoyl-L-alanine amidase [Clostridia bacterium]|nr:N-acetylmuramoyl-L-alanine amidase [Clostridia bacterium]
MKVILDPGHGGSDNGAVYFGIKEKKLNLIFADLLAKNLEQSNIVVDKSLINDTYYSSTQLTDLINNSGASVCISCHNNSFDGNARGLEVIHSIHSEGKLASLILESVRKTDFPVRRAFSREGINPSNKGKDYYYVIRLTYPKVETIIVEFGFMDNKEDSKLLNDPAWQNRLTSAVAEAVKKYIPPIENIKTRIIGKSILEPQQLKAALKDVNPAWDASIVDLYYTIGSVYGVKADLAFIQALHETGWFRFSGTVKPSQNNFAGLGATGGGNPGISFPTKEAGVEAQIQHLFAYSTRQPIPPGRKLYDTRFKYVDRGIAQNWEDLDGRWAVPGIGYGQNIIKMQKSIFEKYPPKEDNNTPIPPDNKPPHWAKPDNDELLKAGILFSDHSGTLDKPASEGMVISLINRLRKEFLKDE